MAVHNLCCLVLRVVTSNILDLFDQILYHHFDQNLGPRDHRASYLLLGHGRRGRLVRDFLLRAFRGLVVRHLRGVDVLHLQPVQLVSSCMLVSTL